MGDHLKPTCTAQSRVDLIHQRLNNYVPRREFTGTKIFDDLHSMRLELIALDKDPVDLFFNGLVLSKLPMRFRNFKTVWQCAPDQSSKSLRMQLVMHDADMEYQLQLKQAKKQENPGGKRAAARDGSYSGGGGGHGEGGGRGKSQRRLGGNSQKPYRSDRKSYVSGHRAALREPIKKNNDSSGKKVRIIFSKSLIKRQQDRQVTKLTEESNICNTSASEERGR